MCQEEVSRSWSEMGPHGTMGNPARCSRDQKGREKSEEVGRGQWRGPIELVTHVPMSQGQPLHIAFGLAFSRHLAPHSEMSSFG